MVTNTATQIPLLLHVEEQKHHDDDAMEHGVSIQVIGANDSKIVATIASHFLRKPKVIVVEQRGAIDLLPELRDRLLILVFRLLISEMYKADGWEAAWAMADATKWIRCQFPNEAAQLLDELRRHVRPGVCVRNTCSVTVG